MYDPKVGRFLSEDPIGFDGGDFNIARYVANSPLAHTDPTGLEIVFEGPEKDRAVAILKDLKKKLAERARAGDMGAREGLNRIRKIEESENQIIIIIEDGVRRIPVGDYENITIDIDDIERLIRATMGDMSKPCNGYDVLVHEIVEQAAAQFTPEGKRRKLPLPAELFKPAHALASEQEQYANDGHKRGEGGGIVEDPVTKQIFQTLYYNKTVVVDGVHKDLRFKITIKYDAEGRLIGRENEVLPERN